MKRFKLLTVYLTALALGATLMTSCRDKEPDPIAVASITLNKTTLSLTPGAQEMLFAVVLPADAANKTLMWTSSDSSIATVDDAGNVKAVAVGTATITVKSKNDITATCAVTIAHASIPVTSVTLNKAKTTLLVSSEEILTATVAPDNATNKNVTWISSANNIATVDKNGKVKAVAVGKATITATAGEKTATCEVTVSATEIPVTGVSLNKSTISLTPGSNETLIATIVPENATNQTITWSSSVEGVATVDNTGKVSGVAEGTATITATSNNGKTATCAVTVSATVILVTDVTLNKSSITLDLGAAETLMATVAPANATDKTITWESSAAHVASIDASGKVTAVAGGTATITALAGCKSATCEVTVNVPVTGVTLNKSTMILAVGGSETLTAMVTPANATVQTITWTSSNSSIAAVDNTGKVIAQAEGTATITATSNNGKTATCTVTVSTKTVPVTGITLNTTTLWLLEGENEPLMATVAPANATDKTVTWSSDKPAIATVDNAGKVTAVAAGSAIITAKAGNKTATCAVNVSSLVIPVSHITLNKTTLSILIRTTETLIAEVAPANATDKTVTWSSDKPAIATVDNAGKVTAVAIGSAIITAKVDDKTATCAVNVNATTHPTHGKIILTADWENVAPGIDKNYVVSVAAQHTASYSGDVNTLNHLFDPGLYRGVAYNVVPEITMDGMVATVATVSPMTVNANPGFFYTAYEPKLEIFPDSVHKYTAIMQQQVRELTITFKPKGGYANHISGIAATLSGITASWNISTSQPYGASVNVAPVFTKQGDGSWKATVRLLGTNGKFQNLALKISYTWGSQDLEYDLSSELATFNNLSEAKIPLDMSATIIEIPTGAGFSSSITNWVVVKRSGTAN